MGLNHITFGSNIMSDKIPLNAILQALDVKDKEFFDLLSDEQKKTVAPFLLNRYMSSVQGVSELQEYYLLADNQRVNTNFFDYSKHPKLQWLLLTTVSPGLGSHRHEWIAPKRKRKDANSKKFKFFEKLYPGTEDTDLQMLAELHSEAEVKDIAQDLGWDKKEIKDIFK